MSHIIGFPAASQEFFQIAFSLFNVTYSFSPDISLSNSVAFTIISLLSKKRFAVSFTTAKAFGRILFKVSSVIL